MNDGASGRAHPLAKSAEGGKHLHTALDRKGGIEEDAVILKINNHKGTALVVRAEVIQCGAHFASIQ